MNNIWSSIPNYKTQTIENVFSIDSHFTKLYEDIKLKFYETYKDDVAEKMLNDYRFHLGKLKELYSARFNYLFNLFKQDLDLDKNKSIIRVTLYGPNYDHTYEEDQILAMALDNFCSDIKNKNYPYTVREEKVVKSDFMDGTCTTCYKILEITLK